MSMKAVLFRAHGGPDKLSYEDLPDADDRSGGCAGSRQGLCLEPSRHLDTTG